MKMGLKRQRDGAMLINRNLPEVPIFFVEGESKSLSEASSQVHQFMAAQYRASLEEHLAAASEEVANIDVLQVTWTLKLIGTWPM